MQNTAGCRFLTLLTKYFGLSIYSWMFCEGYYLHTLLANTFEEEKSLFFITAIGWGKSNQVLLDRVEAKAPCSVLFAPPTSLQRVVCVMNQIHWG